MEENSTFRVPRKLQRELFFRRLRGQGMGTFYFLDIPPPVDFIEVFQSVFGPISNPTGTPWLLLAVARHHQLEKEFL
jgi:hypothetical protein